MIKRIICLLASVLLLAGCTALTGCGEKVTGVAMEHQEYPGNNIYEIPRFEGESKEAVELNVAIYEQMSPYFTGWESVRNDEVFWYEVKSYPVCGRRYKQVVTTAIEYPNYGTDGDVFSFCYDSKKGRQLTLDDALGQAGVSRETAMQRVGTLMTPYLFEGDLVIEVSFPGFVFIEDELHLIARAFVENELASEHDELYVYSVADDVLYDYTGGLLLPAEVCDRTEYPLYVHRQEQQADNISPSDNQ